MPTGAYQLLSSVQSGWPEHTLLLADFSSLPPSMAAGASLAANAPLVASDGGERDHSSYTDVPGQADIFFPTDFEWLAAAYQLAAPEEEAARPAVVVAEGSTTKAFGQSRCEVHPSKQFLTQHGEVEMTRTRTGFNPMVDDYANTCFFVGRRATASAHVTR